VGLTRAGRSKFPRSITTNNASNRQAIPSLEIPLLGRIAAGVPVESLAGNDSISFADFVNDPNTYALQVRGESMVDDHICDGDYGPGRARIRMLATADIVVGVGRRGGNHAQAYLS
jgi:repressor LexA